jgi:hypothetical protein
MNLRWVRPQEPMRQQHDFPWARMTAQKVAMGDTCVEIGRIVQMMVVWISHRA